MKPITIAVIAIAVLVATTVANEQMNILTCSDSECKKCTSDVISPSGDDVECFTRSGYSVKIRCINADNYTTQAFANTDCTGSPVSSRQSSHLTGCHGSGTSYTMVSCPAAATHAPSKSSAAALSVAASTIFALVAVLLL